MKKSRNIHIEFMVWWYNNSKYREVYSYAKIKEVFRDALLP